MNSIAVRHQIFNIAVACIFVLLYLYTNLTAALTGRTELFLSVIISMLRF